MEAIREFLSSLSEHQDVALLAMRLLVGFLFVYSGLKFRPPKPPRLKTFPKSHQCLALAIRQANHRPELTANCRWHATLSKPTADSLANAIPRRLRNFDHPRGAKLFSKDHRLGIGSIEADDYFRARRPRQRSFSQWTHGLSRRKHGRLKNLWKHR